MLPLINQHRSNIFSLASVTMNTIDEYKTKLPKKLSPIKVRRDHTVKAILKQKCSLRKCGHMLDINGIGWAADSFQL